VKVLPKSWENTYFHWVNNLRDWCISRQLWWGHRIPVWYRKDDPERMVCYDGPGMPEEIAKEPEMWEQDPDVLDTWFSSSLWPFSTLGWPEKTPDLEKFYPTSVLVTGHDILFFWVARMILMGKQALNQAPFPETFLHGLIYGKSYWRENKEGGITYVTGSEKREYDLGKPTPKGIFSKWEKLSKSKGNVIDPLEMIEEYGTDAVRMSLCACANQSPQIDLDRRRFEEFKNFANKVWNGARFVFMNLEDLSSEALSEGLDESLLSLEDRWILSAVNRINGEINQHLESYNFDQAATTAYDFFWKEFCAYYVEIAKPILFGKVGTEAERRNKQKLLVVVLLNSIRLLHPMAPFITEELFQNLKERFPTITKKKTDPYTEATIEALLSPACVVAPYPTPIRPSDMMPEVEKQFSTLEKIIYTVRNIRGEMKIPPQVATDVYIVGTGLEKQLNIIYALVKTEKVEMVASPPELGVCATGVVEDLTVIIPLPKELAEKERGRLEKELEKAIQNIERVKKLLSNPEFLEKAKPQLIEKRKATLSQAEQAQDEIQKKLSQL